MTNSTGVPWRFFWDDDYDILLSQNRPNIAYLFNLILNLALPSQSFSYSCNGTVINFPLLCFQRTKKFATHVHFEALHIRVSGDYRSASQMHRSAYWNFSFCPACSWNTGISIGSQVSLILFKWRHIFPQNLNQSDLSFKRYRSTVRGKVQDGVSSDKQTTSPALMKKNRCSFFMYWDSTNTCSACVHIQHDLSTILYNTFCSITVRSIDDQPAYIVYWLVTVL